MWKYIDNKKTDIKKKIILSYFLIAKTNKSKFSVKIKLYISNFISIITKSYENFLFN